MNEIHSKISKQAYIAACCLLDSVKDANEIRWNDICYNLARNLQVNNSMDVSGVIDEASGILDIDIFDIHDLYFWYIAKSALYQAARKQKVSINISKFPNK